jgi:cytochrome d ubiquinol oxidase subunit I
VAAAFLTAGTFVAGIAAWWMVRLARTKRPESIELARNVYRPAVILGTVVMLASGVGVALTGDAQGKLMFEQQPMKMASAEALCHTEKPASFSIIAIGDVSGANCEDVKTFNVPALLSFLAHNDFSTEVKGVENLVTEYQAKYGTNYPDDPALGSLAGKPIDYVPNLPVTYWGFRMMIGFGAVSAAIGVLALWLTRRGRIPGSRWFPWLVLGGIATPFLGNSAGWIFTEMGRQPFVVVPNPSGVDGVWMFTAQAVSHVTTGEVWTSLIALTMVYAALGVVEVYLMRKYVRGGVDAVMPPKKPDDSDKPGEDTLAFAY